MDELHKKNCVACDGNTIPFDISEIHKYLKKVDGWNVKSNDEKNYYLEKNFKFENFIKSQEFVNKVSSVAELEGHHQTFVLAGVMPKSKFLHMQLKG